MASQFQPFDSRKEFHSTRRNLPHWQQPDATYFVTFRLANSLPEEVRERFEEMQRLDDSGAFAWIERYLDAGSGDCILGIPEHAEIVVSSLRHFDGKRYALGSFVVMPNHVHVLVQPIGPATLTSVMHGWKSYTAHELQRRTGVTGRVWQEESFDRIVRDDAELSKYTAYILANPTEAKLSPGTFIVGQGSANWFEPPEEI